MLVKAKENCVRRSVLSVFSTEFKVAQMVVGRFQKVAQASNFSANSAPLRMRTLPKKAKTKTKQLGSRTLTRPPFSENKG